MISINIDFGLPGTAPDSTFGGAGSPGLWNVVDQATATGFSGGPIRDINGIRTALSITTTQTMVDVTPSSQPFSATLAPLLGDYLVGGANTFTMTFLGLPDGLYKFVIYATGRQDNPRATTITTVGDSGSQTNISGVYGGKLAEGETHSTIVRTVGKGGVAFQIFSPSDGFINGIQISPVPEPATTVLVGLALIAAFSRRTRTCEP
jgi:hypothetical protein